MKYTSIGTVERLFVEPLKVCVVDPHHFNVDPIQLLTSLRIRILLLIKVMRIRDFWTMDAPGLHFEPSRLLCERPRPYTFHFEPLKLLNELRGNLLKIVITGKEEKDCMYEQTGLGLFIFDENRFVSFLSFGSLNILNPRGKCCESEKLEFF
jgi:hypothetical protein